jgi:dihydropteroate synthase
VEYAIMHIRLLPQGLDTLTTQELIRMGHQTPATIEQHHTQPFVFKVMDIPRDVASQLTACLQSHSAFSHLHLPSPSPCWWHDVTGEHPDTSDLLIGGTKALPHILRQSTPQMPALYPIVQALEEALQTQRDAPTHLHVGAAKLPLGQRTYVMGIVNVTPDSFSDGGLYLRPEQAIKHAEAMLEDGADIIDVGGASSRPGATPVPPPVEAERVVPVVRQIVERFGALVSVDTYHASVARAALDEGAVMINDISAMRFDPEMASLLASHGAAVVLMHMQGNPQTMQQAPTYRHVIDEIYTFLAERLHTAVQHGIAREKIVCDPGFGFGKTLRHNVDLLNGLPSFRSLGQPLLIGTSRKSFLGRLLQREVWDRLEGTMASVLYAAIQGATLVRVHDVGPIAQAVRMLDTVRYPQTEPRR